MLFELGSYINTILFGQIIAGDARPTNPFVSLIISVRRQTRGESTDAGIVLELAINSFDTNRQAVGNDCYPNLHNLTSITDITSLRGCYNRSDMGVVTITGNNDFARSSELKRVITDFVNREGDLALERVDAAEVEFLRIREALTSLPFLANTKMVVLSNPSSNKDFIEHVEALLTEVPDSTELVIYEPKFDKRSSLYKLLKKQTDFREYNQLDANALVKWLVQTASDSGAKLGQAQARYLVERVGQNQQLLASDLAKLCLAGGEITKDRIDDLTEPTPQSTIFDLLQAAFAGNKKRAIELYDEQRRLKVEPQQIIAMFAWQLHQLAVVVAADGLNSDDIAKQSGMKPFSISKAQNLAAKTSLRDIRRMVDGLVEIDMRSKRESLDLDEALKLYILNLGQ